MSSSRVHPTEEAAVQAEAALLVTSGEQSDAASLPPARLGRLARAGLGAAVALAGVAAVGRMALRPPRGPAEAAVVDGQMLVAATPGCAGEGQDCHASKCCQDGGKNG